VELHARGSGAPLLRKFGNLSIREILVVTSAFARRRSAHALHVNRCQTLILPRSLRQTLSLFDLVLVIDPKGLDSSNNIDSRINITTFFNLPDMFRRYTRHLQCYIFWNRRDVTQFVTFCWQYCVLQSLNLCRLATYRERVRFTSFTCWLRSAFSHFMNIDSLSCSTCRVQDLEAIRCAGCLTRLWTLQMSKNVRRPVRKKVLAHSCGEMSAGFTNITSITTRAQVYNSWRWRIF